MMDFVLYNDPAPTDIYTLSLHDALPILVEGHPDATPAEEGVGLLDGEVGQVLVAADVQGAHHHRQRREALRSEEHTSELQSRPHLVCRLLLEKKNNTIYKYE